MQRTNGHTNEEASTSKGVTVAVESQSEWKIDFINYDGTENFIPPPEFSDVIAKNVTKIPWNKIVDNLETVDVDELEEDFGEDDSDKKAAKELMIFDSIREAAKDKIVPAAGPWAGVAKCLFDSLQEVNVLLDTLRISRTHYLKVQQVAQNDDSNRSADQLNKSKSFLWVSRRKAFADAIHILDIASKARQRNSFEEKPLYFSELKIMRENWRIRKVNDSIFGDLGYRTSGRRFAQDEIFEIFWDSKLKPSQAGGKSCVQVLVPRNLMKRTQLSVSLVKDTLENQEKIFAESSDRSDYYSCDSRELPWQKALKWAQDSLINRDIFTQLMKEAVHDDHISMVTDNCIFVCLTGGMLLRFERTFYPMKDMEIPETGDPYLTSLLRNLFIQDAVRSPHRPQLFVGFPVTSLPETLDLRGPQALSAEEIASRVEKFPPLLARMIQASNHYVLIDQVVDTLGQYMVRNDDPQLTWRWLRCTSTFSMISAALTNQCYEAMGKTTFIIKIDTDEVNVLAKDGSTINCHRQMNLLEEAISLMASNCRLLAASLLGKTYGWQVLHANNNAYSKEGTPAPTFYVCNQVNTKKLFVQFFTDGRPYQIHIKKVHVDEQEEDSFLPVNVTRIPGRSFLRKLDYLYTMFKS